MVWEGGCVCIVVLVVSVGRGCLCMVVLGVSVGRECVCVVVLGVCGKVNMCSCLCVWEV